MAQLAIKGHPTRGKEVIQLLEMLGADRLGYKDTFVGFYYYIECDVIVSSDECPIDAIVFTLEEFEKKFPYKVGDKVVAEVEEGERKIGEVTKMSWHENGFIIYIVLIENSVSFFDVEDLEPYKEENVKEDKGNISDGYHTFNELYEYRLLYNASMFNELAKQGLYDVHKSKLHSDGEIPFGNSNWFIVIAELPTGQISNHYEMKDWDLFQIPEKEKANVWDGHTPQDVANRLREFLTPNRKTDCFVVTKG